MPEHYVSENSPMTIVTHSISPVIHDDVRELNLVLSSTATDKEGLVTDQRSLLRETQRAMELGKAPVSIMHKDVLIGNCVDASMAKVNKNGEEVEAVALKLIIDNEENESIAQHWENIQKGVYKGASYSGTTIEKNIDGVRTLVVTKIYAISLVPNPSNPFALVFEVSDTAKSAMESSTYCEIDDTHIALTCPEAIQNIKNGTDACIKQLKYKLNYIQNMDNIMTEEKNTQTSSTETDTSKGEKETTKEDTSVVSAIEKGFEGVLDLLEKKLSEMNTAKEEEKEEKEETEETKETKEETKKEEKEDETKKEDEKEDKEEKDDEKDTSKSISTFETNALNNEVPAFNVKAFDVAEIKFDGYQASPMPDMYDQVLKEYGTRKGREMWQEGLRTGVGLESLYNYKTVSPKMDKEYSNLGGRYA